jgi:Holliday junction resolvase RusA-like endonuclease
VTVQTALPLMDGALVVGPVLVRIELPGEPVHWPRARARIVYPKDKKPFISFYIDKETEAYKTALGQLGKVMMRGLSPSDRPLYLQMTVYKGIPKSWSAREREAALRGRIRPAGKPDADNYLKIVDGLNEIVWRDDSQVVEANVIKVYSDNPRLLVEVREFVAPR